MLPELVTTASQDRALESDLARQHGGLAIGLEHRYYGENSSIPVGNLDLHDPANLEFLTSDQALADAGMQTIINQSELYSNHRCAESVYFNRSLCELHKMDCCRRFILWQPSCVDETKVS